MKKKFVVCFLLLVSALIYPLSAKGESQQLYKFVRSPEGTLGYDTTLPVPFFKDSTELITIPDTYTQPKNQLKSSWVATISNLNMPKPTSESDFQANYLNTLNTFKEWNMNAMIFQVRPLLDAWYPSEINPWSEFLSGAQGQDPGYDPLAWMIDVTHQAGLEYHAWFNPYRVTNTKLSAQAVLTKTGLTKEQILALSVPEQVAALAKAGFLSNKNYAVQHPEHVSIFDEKLFLNPGIPEVQNHVIATIEEVIVNYDVDAIHFDDYFYPYRITVDGKNLFYGSEGEDQKTFETYGAGYTDIEAWRRDNITSLVQGIKQKIDTHNQQQGTAVQFGISPFGIWEHKANDSRGSNTPTGSSQSYSGSIFADTYKWIKEETLDYVIPQIYWSFDQVAAPYGELARWWNDAAEGSHTQIYIGHANYKHVSNGGWDPSWLNPEEIPNQMKFNQNYSSISGSVLFSYNDIMPSNIESLDAALKERHQAKNDSIQLLKSEYFNIPSLVPAKPWLSHQEIKTPKPVELVADSGKTTLNWQDDETNQTRFFIVYKGSGTAEEVSSKAENIVQRIWKKEGETSFTYQDTDLTRSETEYFISAVDAAGVESQAVSFAAEEEEDGAPVTVHYQDEEKKPLTAEVILEGKIGAAYTSETKKFEGYELVEQPENHSGTFSAIPQTIVYSYKKLATESSDSSTEESSTTQTTDSSSSSTTSEADSSSKKAAQGSNDSNGKSGLSFPSTGEVVKPFITLIGIATLVLGFYQVFKRTRHTK